MIRGTKSEAIIKVLEMIHASRRKTVKEVTLDLSPSMMRIVRTVFPNATMTNDRFHVQKLFYEAIDELRNGPNPREDVPKSYSNIILI